MDFSSRNIEKRKYFFYYKIFWILVGTYIFIAWHLKFEIKFFLLKVCGKNLKLEHFPWICTENFQIRIWICIENFWIQDPDPCKNSYRSASLVKIYTATSRHKNFNLLGLQGFFYQGLSEDWLKCKQFCGSKYIEFGSGSRILALFGTVFQIRISFYADPDPGSLKCPYGSGSRPFIFYSDPDPKKGKNSRRQLIQTKFPLNFSKWH